MWHLSLALLTKSTYLWPAWACLRQHESHSNCFKPVPDPTSFDPQTGTVSSPKGVVLQIWANFPFDGSADPDCNNTGGVLVEMPTIPPGKTKT